jgi:FkbM family methyltransferase
MYTSFHGEIQDGKYVDQVLREYYPNYDYKGIFFDVGAFEPIRISNSYHFEKNGWNVYCFEANPDNMPLLKSERQNVFNYAISNEDKDSITFNVVMASGWTAGYSAINISEDYKRICGWNPQSVKQVNVVQKTLNTIITTEIPNIVNIDIMSIDIEGGELDCLRGLDLVKYDPKVLVVENVTNDISIENYLKIFGYKLDKQIAYNQYYISKNYKL